MPGFPVNFVKKADLSIPFERKKASTSHGDQLLRLWRRRHPKLKLGINPSTPGRLMKSFEPPAGREVQASTAKYVMSPFLGIVTDRGSLRIS